jgi:hypothetical protein
MSYYITRFNRIYNPKRQDLRADIDSRTLHRDIVTKGEDEEEEPVIEEPITITEEDIEEEELVPPRAGNKSCWGRP